jgi:hypothetical protein
MPLYSPGFSTRPIRTIFLDAFSTKSIRCQQNQSTRLNRFGRLLQVPMQMTGVE